MGLLFRSMGTRNKVLAIIVAGVLVVGCDDSQMSNCDEGREGADKILPREGFMETTGCLVSPATYEKLLSAAQKARSDSPDRVAAAGEMTAFLEDLYSGRPTAEGYLDDRCMHPTVRRLAEELTLLDEKGRYKSK